jgi:Mrp family chromosome partitioning ATPase
LNTLSTELSAARSARAAAEARLSAAVAVSNDPAAMQTFTEVLNSEIVSALRAKRNDVKGELDELRSSGAVLNSRIPVLESELAAIEASISEEVNRIVESLRHELDIAQRKEQELAKAYRDLESELSEDGRSRVELDQMEREVSANKAIYETFLTRYKQSIEQQGLALPEARVISWAEAPTRPSTSKTPKLVFGFMFGLFAGVSIAFLRDRLDRRVRTAGELELRTGTPVLALIPKCRNTFLAPPQMHPVTQPISRFSVAIRKLAATLRFSLLTRNAGVILISSYGRGEGKSTLAAALARSYALSGQSVVLVEANLSDPEVARVMGIEEPKGQLNAFLGDPNVTVADILSADPWTNVQVVTAEAMPSKGGYQIGSGRFESLLGELRQRFGVVIIDGPAIAESADVAILGSLADAAILSVEWGSTLADDVVSAIRHFALCDIAVAGLVIGKIAPRALPQSENGSQRNSLGPYQGYRSAVFRSVSTGDGGEGGSVAGSNVASFHVGGNA